jgi:hypothetical protein
VLDLGPSGTPADLLHQRFLDESFPAELSAASFSQVDWSAYPQADLEGALFAWRHRALDEYRSQVAFTELLASMTQAGLPVDSLGTCVRLVRDEARHVELCRRMVKALGGGSEIPGEPGWVRADRSIPPLTQVVQCVVASLCVGETYSARLLARLCDFTQVPLALAANRVFAADESIHSLFGWTLFEYLWPALSEADRRAARLAALSALRMCETVLVEKFPEDVAPNPFGYITLEANQRVYADTREYIVARLDRLDVIPREQLEGIGSAPRARGELPPQLRLCRGCDQHALPGTRICPHCGSDIDAAEVAHQGKLQRAQQALAEVERLVALEGLRRE